MVHSNVVKSADCRGAVVCFNLKTRPAGFQLCVQFHFSATKVVTRAPVDCMCRPCTAVEESAVMPQEIARVLDDGSMPFKL